MSEKEKSWFKPEGKLAVDVYQTERDIVIQSAIAGIKPEELDILIENGVVTIRGNRKNPNEEKKDYFKKECYWGPFSRKVILPEETDPSRAQATIKNGILTIRIPRVEKGGKRKIEIQKE